MFILHNFALPLAGFLVGLFLWSLSFDEYHLADYLEAPVEDDIWDVGPPQWRGWRSIDNIFVFGDAMSNTYFSPFGHQPTYDVPLGNADRLGFEGATYEYPKWINYLQSDHNLTSLLVYNLARWNGTVEKYAYYPHKNGQSIEYNSITLDEQIIQFQATYTSSFHWPDIAAPWTAKDSLFVFWFGADDMADNIERGKELPLDALFASYMASLERMYIFGARSFLLMNAPPTNRIIPDPMNLVGDNIIHYNERLVQIQRKMLERHSDAKIMLFDVNSLLNQALYDPSKFAETRGIANTTSMCDFAEDDNKCKGHFWRSYRMITEPVGELVAASLAEDCLQYDRPVALCSDAPK